MTAKAMRTKVFADLEKLGFRPAKSLPMPDLKRQVRSPAEIGARLMALDALFTWVAFSEKDAPAKRVKGYMDRNDLRDWMTESEQAIVALPRKKAYETHVDMIGWRLENMWGLAWALGFDPEPDLLAAQVGDEVTRPMIFEFLPGLEATVDDLVAKETPRSTPTVIEMEYRFYCAHNAVRSAQLGGKTVPNGFHPVVHGGAVHERRHALTWCLSPDTDWEETDLST